MLLQKDLLAALVLAACARSGSAKWLEAGPLGAFCHVGRDAGCRGNSTDDRARAYGAIRHSARWEHVRERAADPYFSINHAALKRYAPRAPHRFVENDELVIILMASAARADRARAQRETWARAYPHLFIVGDAADPAVPMVTLPELAGRGSYEDAQHRQLRFMRYLLETRPELLEKRYFMLVDDDTWVNMPLVQTLLAQYNETHPFALGLVMRTEPPPGGNNGFVLSWLSGGSGIFLSQAAFRRVAHEMYGELCPFDRLNDVTLARCFSTLGVLKVNDDGCHAKSLLEDEPALAERVHNQAVALHTGSETEMHYTTSLHNQLTFHHMHDRAAVAEATCVAEWEAGFIEDVLPCRLEGPAAKQARRARLRL